MPAVTQHKVKSQQNSAFPGLIVPNQNVTIVAEAQVQFRKLFEVLQHKPRDQWHFFIPLYTAA
ncbi:hypothetical protein BK344_17915 [Escherichia coli]|uniref:Uncharacterized protein n=1 Tax=Escherichia coli TaxID=562 RepID=A0A6H0A761_ECOLX|nr:hypothetical protein BK344_17915 [Escherichia coli]OJP65400.1 hypothetical protein BK345_17915 [Escherichia coli]QIS35434.1 hypothetical protein [Escherichia coli]